MSSHVAMLTSMPVGGGSMGVWHPDPVVCPHMLESLLLLPDIDTLTSAGHATVTLAANFQLETQLQSCGANVENEISDPWQRLHLCKHERSQDVHRLDVGGLLE